MPYLVVGPVEALAALRAVEDVFALAASAPRWREKMGNCGKEEKRGAPLQTDAILVLCLFARLAMTHEVLTHSSEWMHA